jgi:hypothetical protein
MALVEDPLTSISTDTIVSQSVLVEMTLPKDWKKFRLPPALDERLQELLDRQDRDGK